MSGLVDVFVVVVVVVVAAPVPFLPGASSVSARMLSSRDSTPATACERNEPHLDDDCFPGAAMAWPFVAGFHLQLFEDCTKTGCYVVLVLWGGLDFGVA